MSDCGCDTVKTPVRSVETNQQLISTHCLASEYRLDFGGQATGDLDPIITTTADKIVWCPLPDNTIYNGAPCLTDTQDATYRPISNVSEWMQWVEQYVNAAYCDQLAEACQWSHATNGAETIPKGLVTCLEMTTAKYTIVWDTTTKTAVAGEIGYENLACTEVNGLLQQCVQPAPANQVPEYILGADIDNPNFDATADAATQRQNTNGMHRFPYRQEPEYLLEATIPADSGNNRKLAVTKATRHVLRNVNFDQVQTNTNLITNWDVASGRLICGSANVVWVTLNMMIAYELTYTATTATENYVNINFGIATFDANGTFVSEYRLDEDRVLITTGTFQTGMVNGQISIPLTGGVGSGVEPRLWIGGNFTGQIDLQIASSPNPASNLNSLQPQSILSIFSEEVFEYEAKFAAA